MTRAGDVLPGDTLNERIYRKVMRAFWPVTLAFAAAPYPIFGLGPTEPGRYGYEIGAVPVRAFFVLVALLMGRAVIRSRGPLHQATLRITRHAMYWTSGWGEERTIARAAVRSTSCSAHFLRFEPATDEKIRELPIIVFGYRAVSGELQRQGWNITSYVDPGW